MFSVLCFRKILWIGRIKPPVKYVLALTLTNLFSLEVYGRFPTKEEAAKLDVPFDVLTWLLAGSGLILPDKLPKVDWTVTRGTRPRSPPIQFPPAQKPRSQK